MIQQLLNSFVILIVLLGTVTILRELHQHFQKKKRLPSALLRWRVSLVLIGIWILVEKTQDLFRL